MTSLDLVDAILDVKSQVGILTYVLAKHPKMMDVISSVLCVEERTTSSQLCVTIISPVRRS